MPAARHGSPSRWIRVLGGDSVDDAAALELARDGDRVPEPARRKDPDDDDEPEENEADEVEATAGRLDLVGRDEVPVDADEQGRLAEGDEPEHEARDARGPGQADEPPAAGEVAADQSLQLGVDRAG